MSLRVIPASELGLALTFDMSTSVAEDPSGATVCTTQWNKIQSCYTSDMSTSNCVALAETEDC